MLVPRTFREFNMSMTFTMKPYHSKTVGNHGDRRRSANRFCNPIGWIFKPKELLAIVEGYFDRPSAGIGVQNLAGVPIQARTIKHLVRVFSQHITHQHYLKQSVFAGLIVQRVDYLDFDGGVESVLIERQSFSFRLFIFGPRFHSGQTFSFLPWSTNLLLTSLQFRCGFIQRPFGMDMANLVYILGQLLQDTSTTVGAVASHHELPVREPTGRQCQQFHGQFWTCSMGRALRLFRLLPFLRLLAFLFRRWLAGSRFALRHTLTVSVKTKAKRQTTNFYWCPPGIPNNQTQHHLIVAPTGDLFFSTRHQRVMMHSRTIHHESPFACKRVVDCQFNHACGCECSNEQQEHAFRQFIQFPRVLAEKPVVIRKMSFANRTTRYNHIGDKPVTM